MIIIKQIDNNNRDELLQLKIAPSQDGFVETVQECLSEAQQKLCWRPVAIYDDETLIGFAMYGFFWQYLPLGRVWLDRILIDQRYQGKGLGTLAIKTLIEQIRHEYWHKKIYLSVVDKNKVAIKLYQKLGFQFTGELDINKEKVMVLKK